MEDHQVAKKARKKLIPPSKQQYKKIYSKTINIIENIKFPNFHPENKSRSNNVYQTVQQLKFDSAEDTFNNTNITSEANKKFEDISNEMFHLEREKLLI